MKIPNIEYFNNFEEIAVMGYKVIDGIVFSPTVYKKMNFEQKEKLKQDISNFLKKLHDLNVEKINQFYVDDKVKYKEELKLLKLKVYDELTKEQKKYMDNIFDKILNNKKIFNSKKCLCHNDFSCNHIILNKNYELEGIIDFGDACITNEFCDFLYLLEDSNEEIGRKFGLDVLKFYGLKQVEAVVEYSNLKEEYYPIEIIICGIKNNNKKLFNKGLKLTK